MEITWNATTLRSTYHDGGPHWISTLSFKSSSSWRAALSLSLSLASCLPRNRFSFLLLSLFLFFLFLFLFYPTNKSASASDTISLVPAVSWKHYILPRAKGNGEPSSRDKGRNFERSNSSIVDGCVFSLTTFGPSSTTQPSPPVISPREKRSVKSRQPATRTIF